jgi:hypothetical protein
MRCTVCTFEQVSEVDTLLASGSSIRKVSHMYGLARSTVARHRRHVAPASKPFGLIDGGDVPRGTPDPLAEAFLLAERARTPRERLRALEQVRAATKLRMRGVEDPDSEHRELLDDNIRQAESAYRDAPDFETAARALSGWREALLQRLDAVRAPGMIEVPVTVTLAGGKPLPDAKPATATMSPEVYWKHVPQRFRDLDRFVVHRVMHMAFSHVRDPGPGESIKVYELGTGGLVWAKHPGPDEAG